MTKIGMRVIVARGDVRPLEIDTLPLQAETRRADIWAQSATERWDATPRERWRQRLEPLRRSGRACAG